MIDLSIIIVSWNVRTLLERCLSSIYTSLQGSASTGKQDALQCEVIVVDNASTDGSPDMVRQRFPAANLIVSDVNLGFTRANNIGIAYSSGRYILLLNPDTEVLGNALVTMVAYMDKNPDIGALGPKLLFPNGHVQPSRRRFPTLATAFLESTILQQWLPRNRVLHRYYVQDRSDDEEQDVDWVIGACLLLRRQAWEQVGPLDEGFFMYSEELDWCRRLKTVGWRVVYIPWAEVIHHEGQSSSQVMPARHIYFQSSKVRYFRKHHGVLAGEILRFFLLATYVYQLCLESLKWLLGHKRPLRRERIKAYLRVLRSCLRAQGEVPG
ncbi:MAG: glycosyltransferase family 2 protein [Chloroflexi bacterium]|nr:glycosyltransferase family 2 protein [Chloroflexota bacterium]